MTNTMTDVRGQIVTVLSAAGITTLEHVPERLNPPVALLGMGSPWIEQGEQFGAFLMRYKVTLVVPTSTNEVATNALDAMVAKAIIALDNSAQFDIERVEEPTMLAFSSATYPSAALTLVHTSQISSQD